MGRSGEVTLERLQYGMPDWVKILILLAVSPLIFGAVVIYGVVFPIVVLGICLFYIIKSFFNR